MSEDEKQEPSEQNIASQGGPKQPAKAAQGRNRQNQGNAGGQGGPGGPGPGKPQGAGNGNGGGGQQGPRKQAPQQPTVIQTRPLAEPAGMKRRHWGILISFAGFVLLPMVVVVFYLWAVALDQYSSTTGFTVRQEEAGSATDLLGGLAQFAGRTGGSDSDILYEFIQSQEIVEKIQSRLDLIGHYSARWGQDPVFALWPDASTEDLLWYWQRIVRISYDQSTGLIDLEVLAYDAETARAIAREIVRESQDMINKLNTAAREDAMRYARIDLDDAIARLKTAREALTKFRLRTQIVDPDADIQGRMGVLNNLQQQLAEAFIEYDLLLDTSAPDDPRLTQARRRIQVVRERIAEERKNFATANIESAVDGTDYPTILSEFESLMVDREFAEETYRAALTAMDVARTNASRQSRYLAPYVQPTLADGAEYPQRFTISALAGLFLVLLWGILALVYYSIRDRR